MVIFYTFLYHEKSKWFLNAHEKYFWTCSILKENQMKDKYVTNKMHWFLVEQSYTTLKNILTKHMRV